MFPELLLRGMSSFSDGSTQVNQPTIVLDGVEISMQDLYDLDINEIENITVLKMHQQRPFTDHGCQWGNRGGEKEIGRGEYAGIL